jgi:hypothetical protein
MRRDVQEPSENTFERLESKAGVIWPDDYLERERKGR